MPSAMAMVDGQTSFEGGVDAGRTPTIHAERNPTGLKRNQLAWLVNGTVRGGGINCRTGWRLLELNFLGSTETAFNGGTAIFQGAVMYEPTIGFPYMVIALGGHTYRIRVDTDNSVDDISIPGDPNPATRPQAWFCQGEEFLLQQDGVSNALIWDGAAMTRSAGTGAQETPVGTAMDYYMGRFWVANGRTYVASDIVAGPTGTAPYAYRDSILHYTEAAFLAGGGAIPLPMKAGNITALAHNANLDTALGEGQLFIGTRKAIFSCNVPPSRTLWYATTDPLQRVAQLRYGFTSQNSVIQSNGDLFYRGGDNSIRSLTLAIRNFEQWGNVPISSNISRITDREDRGLSGYCSGIEFDNRIWQTVFPGRTRQGVTFQGVATLDFDLITTLTERAPPAWEGLLTGKIGILQLLEADYGGLQRAFAVVLSEAGEIQVWELTTSDRNENTTGLIQWAFETPAYTWGDQFQAKDLVGGTLFVDKEFGPVAYEVFYRPDQYPCWTPWHAWKGCAVRNACEDPYLESCYVAQSYREQYHPYSLPRPQPDPNVLQNQLMSRGYQFQMLVRVTGWARIRGLLWYAEPKQEQPYKWIVS